ncbi:MAG TPA: hypothetical protein DCM59_16830 [Clostridium sp.]|nr:hypothetical protein [Clostridium sp.]
MSEFFNILVAMTNVAMTIPYMFLAGAFISFKRRDEIEKPFVVFKSKGVTIFLTIVVTAVVGFANLFSIIEPAIGGDVAKTIWSIAGPIFFSIVALALFARYEKNVKKDN